MAVERIVEVPVEKIVYKEKIVYHQPPEHIEEQVYLYISEEEFLCTDFFFKRDMGNVLKRDMENVLKRDTHGEGSCFRFVLFLRECGMQEWMGRLWSLTDGYGL